MSFSDIWAIVSALMAFDWLSIIGAVNVILGALIFIFCLIPGEEPEATLKKIVEWLSKFSRK